MDAFCMKCRAKREILNPVQDTLRNGRPATRGTCAVCGTRVIRIASAEIPPQSPQAEILPESPQTERVRQIEVGGQTHIHDEVIAAIVGLAAREVDGVSSMGSASFQRSVIERVGAASSRARGVVVEAGRREAILDLQLRIIFGYSIPDVVIKVRHNVARQVLELCGMVTKEINIVVSGIDFSGRIPGRVE